jgi:hypothetical protein
MIESLDPKKIIPSGFFWLRAKFHGQNFIKCIIIYFIYFTLIMFHKHYHKLKMQSD